MNRQIKADNAVLRMLKAQIERLSAIVEKSASAIAAALEAIRERLIITDYGIRHINGRLSRLFPSIQRRSALKQEYDGVRKTLRQKIAERKKLHAEKKALSPIHVKRHLELASTISGLTEEIEELRSQIKRILARTKCADDSEMKGFANRLDQAKRTYNDLVERKTALTAERQDGITQYEDVYEQIQLEDMAAVEAERKAIRSDENERLSEKLHDIYGDSFDPAMLPEAEKSIDYALIMDKRIREQRREMQQKRNPVHEKPEIGR